MLAMTAGPALADEFSDAVEAFLNEDYSRVGIIAEQAEEGVPQALSLLGQAYIYGRGVEVDQPLGVALLEQAASLGERSSAVQLGRVYEFGLDSIPADPIVAAEWYVAAAKAGDMTSAPAALLRLPRDIVIASGGAAWAAPETDGETAPASITPATMPEPPLASPSLAQEAAAIPQAAASPSRAILGADQAPPPLAMLDKTSFPLFADTRLSAIGDAAASCQIVLKPEIDRRQTAMNSLMELGNNTTLNDTGVGYSKLLEAERDLKSMNEALRASERILSDPRENGGLSAEAVQLALAPHRNARDTRPESGPSALFCGKRLVQLIGESAGWAGQ